MGARLRHRLPLRGQATIESSHPCWVGFATNNVQESALEGVAIRGRDLRGASDRCRGQLARVRLHGQPVLQRAWPDRQWLPLRPS